jgi:alpha/beta superfamily hydrolase
MPVWLAGYSFGSNIVWRAIERAGELAGVVLIAPPVGMMDFSARPTAAVAVNIIAGNIDSFVDGADLQRWIDAATPTTSAPPIAVDIIDGADHFFSGAYENLAHAVERALTQRGLV